MLKIENKPLFDDTINHLAKKQADINGLADNNKRKRANSLWRNKSTGVGITPFTEIKKNLTEMSIGGRCNYCEHNEGGDIEHILPKSVYPQYTFTWENYLLACTNCNRYKSDKMQVFTHEGGLTTRLLSRRSQITHNEDIAFVHSRRENPMDFMELNFDDFQFYARPPHIPNTREYIKTEKTLHLLKLNRDFLIERRKEAFYFYKSLIAKYCIVKEANTDEDLSRVIKQDINVNDKNNILTRLKNTILKWEHPTILREMIRQAAQFSPQIQTYLSIISIDFNIVHYAS